MPMAAFLVIEGYFSNALSYSPYRGTVNKAIRSRIYGWVRAMCFQLDLVIALVGKCVSVLVTRGCSHGGVVFALH